jgi:hypothetical protein
MLSYIFLKFIPADANILKLLHQEPGAAGTIILLRIPGNSLCCPNWLLIAKEFVTEWILPSRLCVARMRGHVMSWHG